MRRTLQRLSVTAGAGLVLSSGLGLVAAPGQADGRDDSGPGTSIDTGPICWEGLDPALDPAFAQAAGSDPCELTVRLSEPVRMPVTVHLATFDGTAVAPDDYEPIDLDVVIPAGQLFAEVPLVIVDDGVDEPDEWFGATLSSPSVGSIGTGRAEVTIQDGAPPPPR